MRGRTRGPRRGLRGALAGLLALMILAGAAGAWAQGAPAGDGAGEAGAEVGEAQVVGLFAPRAPFASTLARKQYVDALAAALGRSTGLSLRGRAFTSAAEFEAQAASGRLAFAVVEAQAVGAHTPVAQARRGGQSARPMVLAVAPGVSAEGLTALAGRSLAPVAVGPGDDGFVFNFLLQGEVAATFFGAGRGALDGQGALALVEKGRADAAFVWQGAAGGLRTVFVSRPVPLPVLVQVGAMPAAAAAAARAGLGELPGAPGVFDGFGAVDTAGLAALKRSLGPPQVRTTAPVWAPMATELPPVTAHPAPVEVAATPLPDPSPALGLPAPPPDRF